MLPFANGLRLVHADLKAWQRDGAARRFLLAERATTPGKLRHGQCEDTGAELLKR